MHIPHSGAIIFTIKVTRIPGRNDSGRSIKTLHPGDTIVRHEPEYGRNFNDIHKLCSGGYYTPRGPASGAFWKR